MTTANQIESDSLKCIIETVIRSVASQSGVGEEIRSVYCGGHVLSEIPLSSLFDGIIELMHKSTIESYKIFHRMFRRLPVMHMVRETLEKFGYHFATSSLSDQPFMDPRMVEVYTAFMKACISLESTAKQYHIMFGRRDSYRW